MPRELSPAEERAFARYEALGTPEELQKAVKDVESLKSESADRRQKVKELETALAEAKPPEGTEVLTGDDAAEWKAFKALNLKAADVAKVAAENETLKADVADRNRKEMLSAVVKAMKWPDENAATLASLKPLDGAAFEVKTEKVEGKDEQVAYVTLAGEGQKAQRFSDYVASAPEMKGIRTETASSTNGATNGRTVPAQRGAGGGSKTTSGGIDDLLAANAKAASSGNPLNPAKAAT